MTIIDMSCNITNSATDKLIISHVFETQISRDEKNRNINVRNDKKYSNKQSE